MLGPDVSFEIFSDGNMVVSGHGEITEITEDIKNRDSVVSIVFKRQHYLRHKKKHHPMQINLNCIG